MLINVLSNVGLIFIVLITAQAHPNVSDDTSKLAPHRIYRFHHPESIVGHTPRIRTVKLALMAPHQNF